MKINKHINYESVSHLHKGTGKLRKNYGDTVGYSTQSGISKVSEKWPSAQCFNVQRENAWLGWSPGTEHLLHTERCQFVFPKKKLGLWKCIQVGESESSQKFEIHKNQNSRYNTTEI